MDVDEVRAFRTGVKALQRRLRQQTPPKVALSRSVLQVLAAVHRLPSGSQPGQVAAELQMTSSNVAAALRELEGAGLLVRTRAADDARRVLLSTTAAGAELIESVHDEGDAWLGQAIAASLTASEQAVLARAGELMLRVAAVQA